MSDEFDIVNEVSSLDTVPEQYKPLYQPSEDGAKFVLEAGIAKRLDVTPLKSALQAERKLREDYQKQAKMAKAYDDLGVTPEMVAELVKSKNEGGDGVKPPANKDEIENLRKQMTQQHTKELEAYQNTTGKLKQKLQSSLIDDVAIRALTEEKGSVELLLPHIRNMVQIEFDDEYNATTKVYGKDGEPMVDREGKYFSVKDLVKYLKTQDTFARAFDGEGRSGGGTPPGTGTRGTGGKNPWSKEGFNLTEQGRLVKENPALAERLKRDAGK